MIKSAMNTHKRHINALFALTALLLFFVGLANYRSLLGLTDDLVSPRETRQQRDDTVKTSPMDVHRALNELSRRH